MKICFDTRSIHPHMAPLASYLRKLLSGEDSITYVYRSYPNDPNRAKGAEGLVDDIGMFWDGNPDADGLSRILSSDVLIENHRDFSILEERSKNERCITIYQSERWFKPIDVGFLISGFFRMLFPFGLKRAIKIFRLLKKSKGFYYFPLGEHAARDMARICGLLNGDIRCIFRAPQIEYEKKPCGRIWLSGRGKNKKYCLDKMRMWGYFVPSVKDGDGERKKIKDSTPLELKILWVGRLLALKNVDVIIKAVCKLDELLKSGKVLRRVRLDIYGEGPEESYLKRMVKNCSNTIHFHPFVHYSEVRRIMREHDVYVFPSNELEGWGAVLNEAIEEGMSVLSSSSVGASVMLPKECLFKYSDVNELVRLLSLPIPKGDKDLWTAKSAANNLKDFIGGLL